MTTSHSSHLPPEELDRLLAGGSADPAVRDHLAGCDRCRREVDDLRTLLRLMKANAAPPLDAGYGRRAWRRIESRILTPDGGKRDFAHAAPLWRRFAIAAALLVAIVGATTVLFWHEPADRTSLVTSAPDTHGTASPIEPEEARLTMAPEELAAEIGTHLESSWRLLVEVSNASPGDLGALEAAGVEERAHRLAAESRRYLGLAAVREPEIRSTLRAMEAFLAEMARAPSHAARDEEALRDLLFEARLAQARMHPQGRGMEL